MGKPIVVFGSFVVDLTGRVNGLPLPGQTILGKSFKMGPGGKGSNQAVAAHRAGADVTLVTKLGNDIMANVAMEFYQKEGMRTEHIMYDAERATGVALITVDETSAQNEIVVIPGACENITMENVEKSRALLENAAIVLFQQEINMDAQKAAMDIAYRAGARIILNPAPAMEISDDLLAKVDTITPNESEVQILTGIKVNSYETAEQAAKVFLKKGVKNVVITMGALGAYATNGKESELLPRIKVEAIDTTGAGDAFNGGFVTALSEGKTLFEALRYGNAAGALSVTRMGTAPSMPLREEIDKMVNEVYILEKVDHTLLSQSATWEEIRETCDDAMYYKTASVCIPPCYVKRVKEYVGDNMKVCTVIGFPNGNHTTKTKIYEAQDALDNGADELDMVINIGALKEKKYDYVENEIEELKKVAGHHILKVIIETSLLDEDEKIKMCEIVTRVGADFIKTSTGFSTMGATFEDIALFRKHVGNNVRIKASGGIKSFEDAEKFICLGASRLGTSRLVKLAKEQNNKY